MLRKSVPFLIAGLLALPGVSFAKGTVWLPDTNQTTCFDSKGMPRSCSSGSGEDGVTHSGEIPWPASRFTDNGNGTVTDKLTGLIWSKHANAPNRALPDTSVNNCPNAETNMLWQDALDFITCLNANQHAGFSDWRLPNVNELESMVNLAAADSAAYLNANGFGFGPGLSQVQPIPYWAATSNASDPAAQSAAAAWDVDLVKGNSYSTLKNELSRGVWPVRGASTGLAQLIKTGQSGCFDDVGDTGDKRPCSETGEDGEKLAGTAWPAERFKVNAGATFAFDRVTGLIWSTATQTPGPSSCDDTGLNLDWQQALDHVDCLNDEAYLGRSDWRLPNRKELQSLTDYSRGAPALPAGHPFNDKLGKTYWTGTTDASSPTDAWVVRTLDGNISSAGKAATLPAWPVSGPDLALPSLTIDQGDMSIKATKQTISGTVDAGATVTVSVKGGTPVAANVTGTTWSYTIDPLATGVSDITVSAANFSENIKTAAVSITKNIVAPVLFLNPVTTLTNRKSHTLSGTVEAGATVAVMAGTTNVPVTVDAAGTTWSSVIPALVEGTNTITVTATDAAGTQTTLPPATITLDTIPPVTAATPAPGSFTDSVAVTLKATEAGSIIHYTTDGTPVTTASPVYSAPIKLAATATTPFTVQFMAVDQAGNAEPVNKTVYIGHLGCDLNGDGKVDV